MIWEFTSELGTWCYRWQLGLFLPLQMEIRKRYPCENKHLWHGKLPFLPYVMDFYWALAEKEMCIQVWGVKKLIYKTISNPTEMFYQEWMPNLQNLSPFLLLCLYFHNYVITPFSIHVTVKSHLWIWLFTWVSSVCFPALVIHWWDPFKRELKHWQILRMFHLKQLWSSLLFKEVNQVQFLLLGYCSSFLELHLGWTEFSE